ncbi:MAG: ribbon-helix-helix protein, CopG family [bacterium]
MNKKIRVDFTISKPTKMVFDKLAADKNMSKSELIERIIIDYFDSKKDDLMIRKIQDDLENLRQDLKDLIYKNEIILNGLSRFNEEKLAVEVIKKMQKMQG